MGKPVVIVGGKESWPSGAVEALLQGHGYRLRRAVDVGAVVQAIRSENPDLVLLTGELADGDGLALCQLLRRQRWLATTPIGFLCAEGRNQEMSALEAGAWYAVRCPPDPQLFLTWVRNAIHTKQRADEAMRLGLIDQLTGCYNRMGIATRLREEMIHARRHREPLACLVVSLEPLADLWSGVDDPETGDALIRTAANVMRLGCRRSDVLGRHDDLDFAIVAPTTGREGCPTLSARLVQAFAESPLRIGRNGSSTSVKPIAGIAVRGTWSEREEDPETLITEASEALAAARAEGRTHRIYSGD